MGKLETLEAEKEKAEARMVDVARKAASADKAVTVVQEVASNMQEELEIKFSEAASSAMSMVFDDPYQVGIYFVAKRGKVEAELSFSKDGERFDPLSAAGGGAVDVASFALRLALWSCVKKESSLPVFIMDEPFKFVSLDLQEHAMALMKEVSNELGLQLIVISHIPDMIDQADVVVKVSMKNGRSVIA